MLSINSSLELDPCVAFPPCNQCIFWMVPSIVVTLSSFAYIAMFSDPGNLDAHICSAKGEYCLQELFGSKWKLSAEFLQAI